MPKESNDEFPSLLCSPTFPMNGTDVEQASTHSEPPPDLPESSVTERDFRVRVLERELEEGVRELEGSRFGAEVVWSDLSGGAEETNGIEAIGEVVFFIVYRVAGGRRWLAGGGFGFITGEGWGRERSGEGGESVEEETKG